MKTTEGAAAQDVSRIAFLVAVASVLQTLESFIPTPVPGLRLGLASMPVLVAMADLGFAAAFEISLLRVLLSSLIMGTFMSPGFFLSFSAAVASTLTMGLLFRLSSLHPRVRLSIFGISIAGAFVHNAVQLGMAYLVMIRHTSVFMFFPWLSLGAVATGWVTASVAAVVLRRIHTMRTEGPRSAAAVRRNLPGGVRSVYLPGDSLLHRVPLPAKLSTLCAVAVLLLFIDSFAVYAALFAALAAYLVHFRAAAPVLAARIRRYAVLLSLAFCLPALLTPGGVVLVKAGFISVTREGLMTGALFAVRNLFLIAAGYLVMMTTPLDRVADGFSRTISFLRPLGISGERVGAVMSEALIAMGFFWEAACRAVREADVRRVRGLRNLVPVLGGIVAELYLDARDSAPAVPAGDVERTPFSNI